MRCMFGWRGDGVRESRFCLDGDCDGSMGREVADGVCFVMKVYVICIFIEMPLLLPTLFARTSRTSKYRGSPLAVRVGRIEDGDGASGLSGRCGI